MKIKKILLSSIIAASCYSANAAVLTPVEDLPSKVAYFTGWSQPANSADKFIANAQDNSATPGVGIDQLNLAFLRWDAFGDIKDDSAFVYNSGSWQSNAYKSIRTIYAAVHNGTITGKKTKFIVSFGGYSYAGMWDAILDEYTRGELAKNLVALMGNKIGRFWNGYRDIEGLSIDGIDFDFERSIRMTPELNDALILLVEKVRELQHDTTFLTSIGVSLDSVKDDLVTLTTYHVAADPVKCGTNLQLGPDDGCSYVNENRSIHHGEDARLFSKLKGKNLFDAYNVMEYDAGRGVYFHPEVSIDNYLKYVPANRLLGGVTVKLQWGPDGNFTKTIDENAELINLYKSKNLHGYFTWSIGGNTSTQASEIDDHYTFAKMWENIIANPNQYTPEQFQASNSEPAMRVESVLGRDHTIVAKDGKTYVVIGNTWYDTGRKRAVKFTPEFHKRLPLFAKLGRDANTKTIVVDIIDVPTHTVLYRVEYSPRGYWSKRWRYPMAVAARLNALHLPYLKAGQKRGNSYIPIASSYRNSIWMNDDTKAVKVYSKVTNPL